MLINSIGPSLAANALPAPENLREIADTLRTENLHLK